eukprot:UN24960
MVNVFIILLRNNESEIENCSSFENFKPLRSSSVLKNQC